MTAVAGGNAPPGRLDFEGAVAILPRPGYPVV